MTVPDVSPDLPGTGWRLTLALLGRLPQAALSRGFGRLADVPVPRALRTRVLGAAARALGIDLGEAELPLEAYGSLNALFVRRLRAGARPISTDEHALASPVDGVLGQVGRIRDGRLVQAKGRHYTAAALLGDERLAARFAHGSFLTIYLSPRHYHRIHAPCSGEVARALHVPGALLPVNEPAVQHITGLFPRNERLIACMNSALGSVVVAAIGAYNVGRISAAFDPAWSGIGWVTNRRHAGREDRSYFPALPVRKGEEIMAFHLGSTVVLLCERELEIDAGLVPGTEVRLGTDLARITAG